MYTDIYNRVHFSTAIKCILWDKCITMAQAWWQKPNVCHICLKNYYQHAGWWQSTYAPSDNKQVNRDVTSIQTLTMNTLTLWWQILQNHNRLIQKVRTMISIKHKCIKMWTSQLGDLHNKTLWHNLNMCPSEVQHLVQVK